jgi:hypothetical protein
MQMKKLLYDIQVWFIFKYAWLRVNNPWHHAYLRAKMAAYRDSDWWRIRATEMSPEFADQHFIDNGEHRFFDSKVKADKTLMARIILLPFSVTDGG